MDVSTVFLSSQSSKTKNMVEVEESSAPVITLNPLMVITSETPSVFLNISDTLEEAFSIFCKVVPGCIATDAISVP